MRLDYLLMLIHKLFKMRHRWAFTLFVLMTLCYGHSYGQLRDFSFEHISEKQGLTNQWIADIAEDDLGFIWIATDDGLFRFDGQRCTLYNRGTNNIELHDQYIASMCFSSQNTIHWIGTHHGLYARDTRNGMLMYFTNYAEKNVSSTMISSIIPHGTKGIYFATRNDVYSVESPDQVAQPLLALRNHKDLLQSENKKLLLDSKGRLWVSGTNGKIGIIDTLTNQVHILQYPSVEKKHTMIRTLYEDDNHNVWIGTDGNGVHVYNLPSESFVNTFSTLQQKVSKEIINSIKKTSSGVMLVASNKGLYVYDPILQSVITITASDKEYAGLSSTELNAVFENSKQTIFIGTNGGGLNTLSKYPIHFTNYNIGMTNGIKSQIIRSICETSPDEVLIGTEGGINIFDRKKMQIRFFEPSFTSPEVQQSYARYSIRCFLHLYDKVYLVGTTYGLYKVDFTRLLFSPILPELFYNTPAKRIATISRDSTGDIWLGTGKGVFRLDAKLRLKNEYSSKTDVRGLRSENVFAAITDAQGVLWLGTREGLHRYDNSTNSFQALLFQHADSSIPSFNEIWSLAEDHEGDIWCGTHSGGIQIYRKQKNTFDKITTQNGLPNNVVYGLIRGQQKNMWASTNIGIAQLTKSGDSTTVQASYSEKDGLHGNECNIGALYEGHFGRIYVGGMKGLSEFFPQRINRYINPPPIIHITKFKVLNVEQHYDTIIEKKYQIILPYSSNHISLQFTALSYVRAYLNKYRFMLQGYDKDWVDAGSSNEANYTNLPPGTYVFHVIAGNAYGVWNEKGTRLTIIVLPPWWTTMWFRFLCVIAFLGMLWGIYYYRTKQLVRINRKLDVLVKQRTQQLKIAMDDLEENNVQLAAANYEIQQTNVILAEQSRQIELHNTELEDINHRLQNSYTDLYKANEQTKEFMSIASHDIRNPLTTVLLNLDIIFLKCKDILSLHPMMKNKLEQISQSSSRILSIVETYLSIHRAEQGLNIQMQKVSINDVVRNVIASLEEHARTKNIGIELSESDLFTVESDSILLTQIFENIFSNALKYSHRSSTIFISIQQMQDQYVLVQCKDQGQGLYEEEIKNIFTKFSTMSSKPTGNETQHGVGMFIVKKMIDILQGTIVIESPGKNLGTTVSVKIPQ